MTLKNFIETFNLLTNTAVLALREDNNEIISFNNRMKVMFPTIETGTATTDIPEFGKIQLIGNEDDDSELVFVNTPVFDGYIQMTEQIIDFEDTERTRIVFLEPSTQSIDYKFEKFHSIFSAVFSKHKEVVAFLYLDKMEYEYVHISDIDVEAFDLTKLRSWENEFNSLVNIYSDEENSKIIADTLSSDAILKAYEQDKSYSVEYSLLVDGQLLKKYTTIDFVRYSDEPIAVIKVKDLNV